MIVVDASVTGPLLLPDESPLSAAAMTMLFDAPFLVPSHWHIEVAGIVRKAVRRGRLTLIDAEAALHELSALKPVIDDQTARRAWTDTSALAHRHDLTIYDAAYLELARRSSSRLTTLDAKLASAAAAEGIKRVALT